MSHHEGVELAWRARVEEHELLELRNSFGGSTPAGWWDRIRPQSLGWVSARRADGCLVGFANVAWDGADHAFVLDPMVHRDEQRRGIGTQLVARCVLHARLAGCEWLHVDFAEPLAPFYFGACGFRSTPAGLIHLPPLDSPP